MTESAGLSWKSDGSVKFTDYVVELQLADIMIDRIILKNINHKRTV
jgi:hypothetical protein